MVALLSSSFVRPEEAQAQWAVVDAGNIAQSTINAANTTSLQIKEFVLDGLAVLIVKQIIRQITASVVNWINSGFQGSPSFLQNPGSFFMDVADQITGEFISRYGGPLKDLCSPFSIDIRLALSLKYHPSAQKRYSCTITTVINNTRGAIEGASINGFTAGDFRQGGWPTFISMTTEPQNNPYGAYLVADSELNWRVGNAQSQQKDEISSGSGFISWRNRDCVREVRANQVQEYAVQEGYEDEENLDMQYGGEGSWDAQPKSTYDCPIETPGSVINGTLQNNLAGPLRELEIADEINEIVNALFAQLASQILQKGLSSVSAVDTSGSTYLQQTVVDLSQSDPQLQGMRDELLRGMAIYKQNALDFRAARESALGSMVEAKTTYESARLCYVNRIDSTSRPLSGSQRRTAESRISEIDLILSGTIPGKIAPLQIKAQEANARFSEIVQIENAATSSRTFTELNTASQRFTDMIRNRTFVSVLDVQEAQTDLTVAQSDAAPLRQDAQRKLSMCQSL